jgi:hypothetical protein
MMKAALAAQAPRPSLRGHAVGRVKKGLLVGISARRNCLAEP